MRDGVREAPRPVTSIASSGASGPDVVAAGAIPGRTR
jgi:hypothetical protein